MSSNDCGNIGASVDEQSKGTGGAESASEGTKSNVQDASENVKDWLEPNGETSEVITNKHGDKVFLSSDGERKFRTDINNSGDDKPHAHFEVLVNGEWKDADPNNHRIYPKDVQQY